MYARDLMYNVSLSVVCSRSELCILIPLQSSYSRIGSIICSLSLILGTTNCHSAYIRPRYLIKDVEVTPPTQNPYRGPADEKSTCSSLSSQRWKETLRSTISMM